MIETLQEWLSNPAFTRWKGGLWEATWLTLYMTGGTMLLTVLLGTPLGVLLYEADRTTHPGVRALHRILGFVVNVVRSFPFFVLIIVLIPISAALVNRSTGPNAAMVALTVASVPFFARLVELNLREIPAGKIEAVQMMGATRLQVIRQVLLPEALPGLIASITTTTIAVVGYSAMAGAVNSGGLGQLAFNRGYVSYQTEIMVATVLLLIVIVVAIQMAGSFLSRAVDHRARTV